MARGEYSLRSMRRVPSDAVSGSMNAAQRPAAPREEVHLASANHQTITVIIRDQTLVLERHDALALAAIIATTFD